MESVGEEKLRAKKKAESGDVDVETDEVEEENEEDDETLPQRVEDVQPEGVPAVALRETTASIERRLRHQQLGWRVLLEDTEDEGRH